MKKLKTLLIFSDKTCEYFDLVNTNKSDIFEEIYNFVKSTNKTVNKVFISYFELDSNIFYDAVSFKEYQDLQRQHEKLREEYFSKF